MQKDSDYGLLNTQEDPRFGGRPYGRFGTVAKNGCGMIALYNIMRASDSTTRFEPFYDARKSIKTNLFGLMGTRSSSVPKNLAKKDYQVTRIKPKQAGEAKPFDGVIVLYWFFFGAHYVAGIANGDGTYTWYNQFQNPHSMKLTDFLAHIRKKKEHVYRIWGVTFPKK